MLALVVVAVVLFSAAAVIKAVFALCGHRITWQLSIVVAILLGIVILALTR